MQHKVFQYANQFHSDSDYYIRHQYDPEIYIGGLPIWIVTMGTVLLVKLGYDLVDWIRHKMVDELRQRVVVEIRPLTQTQTYANHARRELHPH